MSMNPKHDQLTWSRKASEEAEAVSSLSCSGHGVAHLDGLVLDGGLPVCECDACYTGLDCSQFVPYCLIDVDNGNPFFLEPFWRQNAENSAVMMAGWYRMGYEFADGSLESKQLEKAIRMLHDTVGNAITKGRYIVFGTGSTQLFNAAVYAFSSKDSGSTTAKVVASVPYYPVYKSQTDLFVSRKYKFDGETMSWINQSEDSTNFIEFVTSPNNPDGQLKDVILGGKNVKHIHDLAYYWPHFSPIPIQLDEDLMLFTLSKLTGHCGTRLGWAIVKEESVYKRMMYYIDQTTYGVSRETQLRTLKLLNVVLQGNGRELFDFGYNVMRSRWERLSKLFSLSKRFSLQDLTQNNCTFFHKELRSVTPAYAWIKCENDEDKDCYSVLWDEANIKGKAGHDFGSESRYVRLSLISNRQDFDLLVRRLEGLISQEMKGVCEPSNYEGAFGNLTT
ncbi:OLC1v1024445C2 [Oldenlandia corymbosa var. corymbosa]|nr:OLC1v1024445C2 [Oldenlandia corymbosa var. corymbosa]